VVALVMTEYVAAGANRHPATADWHGDILAYGTDRNIAIWNPEVNITYDLSLSFVVVIIFAFAKPAPNPIPFWTEAMAWENQILGMNY
jgi:hypothetical protein